jgi:hypothetical protein
LGICSPIGKQKFRRGTFAFRKFHRGIFTFTPCRPCKLDRKAIYSLLRSGAGLQPGNVPTGTFSVPGLGDWLFRQSHHPAQNCTGVANFLVGKFAEPSKPLWNLSAQAHRLQAPFKAGEKISSVAEKISAAGHGKPAGYTQDETLAIIEADGFNRGRRSGGTRHTD